jgi:hypothetical protein
MHKYAEINIFIDEDKQATDGKTNRQRDIETAIDKH